MDTTKKILLASIGMALVAFLIGGGTYAYFSDVETATNNNFTAGTLNLQVGDNDPCTENVSIGDLAPGYEGEAANWILKNTGSIEGVLNVSVSPITNNENGVLEPEEGDTDGEGELGANLEVALWVDQSGVKKYLDPSGTSLAWADTETYALLNNFGGKSTTDTISQVTGDPNIGTFHIAYKLPYETGNVVQSDNCTFDITFDLRQPPQP